MEAQVIAILAVLYGAAQIGLLTAIFFRLGRGAARMEELFRRVITVEDKLASKEG